MSEWRINFVGVGRGKKSWAVFVKQRPTERIIERFAKAEGALMSNNVAAIFDDDDEEYGTIYVGGFRPVGAFRISAEPAALASKEP